MKKQDKLDLIQSAIEKPQLCRCYFTYDDNCYYYYPNAVNEMFLLGQEENDFLLDGYCIRKISQLKKWRLKMIFATPLTNKSACINKLSSHLWIFPVGSVFSTLLWNSIAL